MSAFGYIWVYKSDADVYPVTVTYYAVTLGKAPRSLSLHLPTCKMLVLFF